jgi:hypothetical protein
MKVYGETPVRLEANMEKANTRIARIVSSVAKKAKGSPSLPEPNIMGIGPIRITPPTLEFEVEVTANKVPTNTNTNPIRIRANGSFMAKSRPRTAGFEKSKELL